MRLLLVLLPVLSQAQNKSYKLVGVANARFGFSYLYALSFDAKGTSVTGYSVTKQPNGAEFKAEIKGQINRKEHTLVFTETKSLDKGPENEMTICLFDAKLTYKMLGTKYEVAGTFTGHDLNNQPCTEGTMKFETPNAPPGMFHTEKKAPPPAPAKPDIVVKKEPVQPPLPANTITAGVQKQLDWNSDSCMIEVWDGGVIDGDRVTILVNEMPVLKNYSLEKAHKVLRLHLPKETNTITIVADDEGINPPNTAEIFLLDGKTGHRITAFNKKGEKAIIVISKIHAK